MLARRFFPTPETDLSDIPDRPLTYDRHQKLEISTAVSEKDMSPLIGTVGSWKAPGKDLLSNGFLKACGAPLAKRMADLCLSSFILEYYLERFRYARVVMILKPGKPARAKKTIN